MSFSRCLRFVPSIVLAFGPFACLPATRDQRYLIDPEGYVFLDAGSNWGHIATLRIVDWGDAWVHVSTTDGQGRVKTGNLSQPQYQHLLSDLRSLRVFELKSFFRANVNDADMYRIDVRVGKEHNQIQVYCPWEDAEDSDSPAIMYSGTSHGSKPHADLVRRLLREVESDDLRWDVCMYSFHPDRHWVNTDDAEVEDVFFTNDGDLLYATTEYPKWVGGTADEGDGYVVWHSAGKKQKPQRVPFDVLDGGKDDGPGPLFPRPTTANDTVHNVAFPELAKAKYFKVEHLVQPRVLCGGRVGVCVKAEHGTELIAYLLDHPFAYQTILWLDDLSVHRKQIDISPDGSRAAWINNGRLFVTDAVGTDCDWLLERLEFLVEK